MKKFQDALQVLASKMNEIEFLKVIQKALAILTPVTIVGSIASLLAGIDFGGYQAFIINAGIANVLNIINNSTIGIISLITVFSIGYQYAQSHKQKKNAVSIGVLGIIAFLVASPAENPYGYFGATGMFAAIIIGMCVGKIFCLLVEKNVTIKLPEGVPPMVSAAFTAVVPAFVVAAVFGVLSFVCTLVGVGSIQEVIYTIVSVPIQAVGANLFGEVVLSLYCALLFCFGIHGGMVVMPIMMMIFMPKQFENLAAFQAGQALPHMINGTTIGAGYICLPIAILLFAKRKELRDVAKLSSVPALFTINEPLLYGLPICMNPVFFVPYILQSILPILLTHLLQIIGFVSYGNCAQTPWVLPQSVIAFTRFGVKGLILSLIFTGICVLIWAPFIKAYEKQLEAKGSEE